ncbi:MAG: methyl-accepting chemotaxis protein [Gammaproteobacteria bacterium]|nr:MAG: methyl-accepting chemotaxis protein [Gammaproteobacteria bacterium]
MFSMLTIKNKLIGLTLLGLIITAVVGVYSYSSIQQLRVAMNNIVVSSAILRNHMFADMMHDALNSDVNAALIAAESSGTDEISAVEKELKEHSELFTETLGKNEDLISDYKTHAALTKVLPALRTYISSANKIVQTAKTNRPNALAMMSEFHDAFTRLEVEMEALTELIEENVKLTQKVAEDQEKNTARVLVIISVVGTMLMFLISQLVIKNIMVVLKRLVHVSERVAAGDLTVHIDTSESDELGALARAMEKMRTHLLNVISQISDTSSRLLSSVEDIAVVTRAASNHMIAQRSETEQVATAMNEMTATVHEVSNNILATATSAQQAAEETTMGAKIVAEAVQSITVLADQISSASAIINRVEHNSHNISKVVDVIKNIAEQTNLLALNAAIEAARAGEQGRGFAVVADEVRTLASRTQQSTGEINEMISQLQLESKSSVGAMNKSCEQADVVVSKAENAGQSLNTIALTVSRISELSAQIATAAEEQTAVSEEINRNIVHINEAAIYTADGTQKTTEAINQLAKITNDLQQLVKQFNV